MSDKVENISERETVSETLLDSNAHFGIYLNDDGEFKSLVFYGEIKYPMLMQAVGRLEALKTEMIDLYNHNMEKETLVPL